MTIQDQPRACYQAITAMGFGLLSYLWLQDTTTLGFLTLLFLLFMTLLRDRFNGTNLTILMDFLGILLLSGSLNPTLVGAALILLLFQSACFWYPVLFLFLAYFLIHGQLLLLLLAILGCLSGTFLRFWGVEKNTKQAIRDQHTQRYLELEGLQQDLGSALERVEQMTAVAERARISRDIHDNAGHEIIAAYMSLQTIRPLFEGQDPELLELYDEALGRLDGGVEKIRESVHNLSAVTYLGAERLREICQRYRQAQVSFTVNGDTTHVSVSIWNVLEACLNECLTNASRHGRARTVVAELDATPHLIRLSIENDGKTSASAMAGTGLRNLRHRVNTAGGNLSVDTGSPFRVICVIPL